jgi:hypothetical protein
MKCTSIRTNYCVSYENKTIQLRLGSRAEQASVAGEQCELGETLISVARPRLETTLVEQIAK